MIIFKKSFKTLRKVKYIHTIFVINSDASNKVKDFNSSTIVFILDVIKIQNKNKL